VLGIGFYLKRFANSGQIFLAGREMTAWVAGLSPFSQPGRVGITGWPLFVSIRHTRGALVLDRRHPGDALSGHRDDAVLLHLENALGAGLFEASIRRRRKRAERDHIRGDDHPDSGVNMYAMAVVMKVMLGWIFISASGVVADGGVYVARADCIRRFQRGGAVFSDLVRSAADSDLGLIETGGWGGMTARIQRNFPGQDFTHLCPRSAGFRTIRWACTGPELYSAWPRFSRWLLDNDFLVVQRVLRRRTCDRRRWRL